MDYNTAEGRGRGFVDLDINYKIGWVGGGQWYNYTRTFPTGKYNVHVGLSHGDGVSSNTKIGGSLQRVTGATTANQTLVELGTFSGAATGGWGVNRIIPLTDANGAMAAIDLSGTQTLRYTTSNGDFDFILLTPVAPTVITGTPPSGFAGATLTNIVDDPATKTITADVPAGSAEAYLTISPARVIKSVEIVGGKLVIKY